MTQTYQQVQKQIEALQAKAEQLRAREVKGVIDRIKTAIAHYGLTPEQLGFGGGASTSSTRKPIKSKRASTSSKYSDGQGNEWGGRGPHPHWLRDALASGKRLEDFAVGTPTAFKSASSTPKKGTKRKSKLQYRDESGNRWSGMGPRPRWLREALAGGASLEQFLAENGD
jgi:DNA-binding protein H-NS